MKVPKLESLDYCIKLVVTNLIVEEGVLDIIHHIGHNLDVILTLLIPPGVDAFVERTPTVPDLPKCAGVELVRWLVRFNSDDILEQFFPLLVPVLTPKPTAS